MNIVGADTKKFLELEQEVNTYLEEVDADLVSAGIDENYVVKTYIDIPETDESVICLCFYFSTVPKDTKSCLISDILEDHAEILSEISVFIHFASCSKESINIVLDNDTVETRIALFESTIGS